jgi:alpha-ketoglutarate-dependent taurine dioxygenase
MSRGAGRLEPWLNYVSHDDRTLYYNTQVTSYPTSLIQLRDSCACARCVDPHSKQRNFRTSDIPLDIGVEKLFSRGKMLQVLWKNDIPGYEYHSSRFSKEDLMDLHAEHPKRWNRGGLRIPWNKEIFTRNQTWVSFNDFLHNNESFAVAMRALRRYGLIFVKDIPERNTSIEMLATKMGPLRNSFYGLTWDVRSQHNAHNVAYTNKFLGFHMDLLYMADPPGFQLLHCMRNSLAGGESLFSDTHRAVHALMEKEPELYNVLCRFPVRFGYHNGGQQYEYSRTVIERPFPNRVPSLFSYVNYSPPFQLGMVKPKPMGRWSSDGVQRLFVDAMKCFAEELEDPKNMFEMKMNPGECVIFDNRRVVHARNAFQVDSGQPSLPGGTVGQGTARWLRGAYVDEDALLSKFDLLRYHNIGWWDSTNPSDGAWLGQMEWNASPEAIEQWKQESEVLQVKREGEFRRAQQP